MPVEEIRAPVVGGTEMVAGGQGHAQDYRGARAQSQGSTYKILFR